MNNIFYLGLVGTCSNDENSTKMWQDNLVLGNPRGLNFRQYPVFICQRKGNEPQKELYLKTP